jgi:WD40 repeat protein
LEGHTGNVLGVAYSPDGRWIASGGTDGSIRLWHAQTGEEIRRLGGHTDTVFSVAFSPDGRRIACASADGTVRLWNVRTGKEIRQLEGNTNYIKSVAYSPDGRWIPSAATFNKSRFICFSSVPTGTLMIVRKAVLRAIVFVDFLLRCVLAHKVTVKTSVFERTFQQHVSSSVARLKGLVRAVDGGRCFLRAGSVHGMSRSHVFHGWQELLNFNF